MQSEQHKTVCCEMELNINDKKTKTRTDMDW